LSEIDLPASFFPHIIHVNPLRSFFSRALEIVTDKYASVVGAGDLRFLHTDYNNQNAKLESCNPLK
jgi:hypothetical protein